MMSEILIRGMEMPEEGHLIVRIYASGEVCEPTECAGVWGKVATAIPVPSHGDLIDRDELKNKHHWTDDFYETEYVEVEDIDAAPTIIPASE